MDCLQGNFYISFTILSLALEDPSFNLKGIHIVNVILEYIYLGLLIMCFILALGNRPQGSKLGYTMAFIGFGLITVYMTVRLSFLINICNQSQHLKFAGRRVPAGVQGN